MNFFFILSLIFIFTSCSFDNKSGIWKNENNITTSEDQNLFKDFKKIYTENENFSKIIPINKNYKFDTNDPYPNNSWHDIFYNKRNNLINFKYDNLSAIVHKSKKLTKNKANNHKLYSNNNLIISDKKGNIIVYSPKKIRLFQDIISIKNNLKILKKN